MTVPDRSKDYHDYVFKDGKLVGDFEGMYRYSEEVPWHQDANAFDTIADIDIAILKRHRFDRICDVGCGLGHFTARMKRELVGPCGQPSEVVGLDVSPTAVERAGALHPDCRFAVGDLLSPDWPTTRPAVASGYDLVVMRGVLWYVVQDLGTALARFAGLARDGGAALVTLSFPPSRTWVGQDTIGSQDELHRHLSTVMDIAYWCVERDAKHGGVPLCHAFGPLRPVDGRPRP
ncbi:class I SAM-dependent methyltransferase [Polymorphum gilvum]|uniref:class I SAM-dependent methyltransferase n=1 Tax=Polymorphum gilvum TaxID=991904 RepID=UPI00030DE9DF|nr:class I SAM-dependent methyltransferase [Polymorphum gilvum]